MQLLILSALFCFSVAHVYNLANYLVIIDEYITEILKTPLSTKGDDLLQYVEDYYETFLKLHEEFKTSKYKVRQKFGFFVSNKSADFTNVVISDDEIKETFKWDDHKLSKFVELRTNITEFWKVFMNQFMRIRMRQNKNIKKFQPNIFDIDY